MTPDLVAGEVVPRDAESVVGERLEAELVPPLRSLDPVSNFDPPELRSLNPARAERSAQRLRVIEEVVDYARLHPELAEFDSDEPVVVPAARMRVAIEQAIARGLTPSRVMAETGCDYATYRAVLDVPRRGG